MPALRRKSDPHRPEAMAAPQPGGGLAPRSATRSALVPCPCGRDDRLDVAHSCFPAELGLRPRRVADQHRRIAGAAGAQTVRDGLACDYLDGIEDLADADT